MTRRRPPQSFGLCLLAALAVMLLPAPLGSAPRVLTPVSVAANPFITNAPLFIGIEEGYFAAQGIEVKPVQLRETAQSWPLLITGQLDAHAGSYTSGFMQAVAQGAKLRILADKGHTEPGDTSIAFMVRQDLIDFGRYRSPRDLRGMRIGVGARGGVGEMFLLQILRNRALVTEQDVNFQQIQQALVLGSLPREGSRRGLADRTLCYPRGKPGVGQDGTKPARSAAAGPDGGDRLRTEPPRAQSGPGAAFYECLPAQRPTVSPR